MSDDAPILSRPRREEDADLDITPMIDITFLLLAFFVVMSKMDPKRNVGLPISEVAGNTPEKSCIIIYIEQPPGSKDDPKIYIGDKGEQLVTGTAEQISEQIKEYTGDPRFAGEKEYILIKASGHCQNGPFMQVKSAAHQGAKNLKILLGVQSQKPG